MSAICYLVSKQPSPPKPVESFRREFSPLDVKKIVFQREMLAEQHLTKQIQRTSKAKTLKAKKRTVDDSVLAMPKERAYYEMEANKFIRAK